MAKLLRHPSLQTTLQGLPVELPPAFLTGGPVSSPSTSSAPRRRPPSLPLPVPSPPLPPFLLSYGSPSTSHFTALEITVPMGSLAWLQVCIGLALLGADGIVIPCLFQLLQAMVTLPHSEPASYLRAPKPHLLDSACLAYPPLVRTLRLYWATWITQNHIPTSRLTGQ